MKPLLPILLLTLAAPLHAVQPAELIDANLDHSRVRFVGLSGGTLSFFDENRRLQRAPAAEYVSLRLIEPDAASGQTQAAPPGPANEPQENEPNDAANADAPAAAENAALLELADGHAITGRFAGTGPDGQLLWDSPHFGQLAFPLDRILRFQVAQPSGENGSENENAPDAGPEQPPAGDTVRLTNGDTITGFIVELTPNGPAVQVEGQPITLGWEQVAAIRLANPEQFRPGVWAQLIGGSRIRVQKPTLDGESFTGTAFGGREFKLPAATVQAIDFAKHHRLIPLDDLPAPRISGGQVFGVSMPPRLQDETARLHAPVELTFDLPANARRFAADAVIPPDARQWADLELIIAGPDGELARQHLTADTPKARINVPLEGDTLTLRLDPAANGPIQDRLHLDHAALLVDHEQQPDSTD